VTLTPTARVGLGLASRDEVDGGQMEKARGAEFAEVALDGIDVADVRDELPHLPRDFRGEIRCATDRQVVENGHLRTSLDERAAELRAYEAGAIGYERPSAVQALICASRGHSSPVG
jgi:hypothetical protein